MAEDVLPFEFNQIINYDNIDNSATSVFSGYSIDTSNNKLTLNIANVENSDEITNEEQVFKMLNTSLQKMQQVDDLQSQLSSLQNQVKDIKQSVDNDIHNANDKPIVGGVSGTSGIDYRGIYSHEPGNPNRGLKFVNGSLGYYHSGDKEFQPVITPDGIVKSALPNFIGLTKENVQSTINTNNNENSGDSSGSNNINNGSNNSNSNIDILELPSKPVRDDTGKVIEVDYYQNEQIAYKEMYLRNDKGKIISITLIGVNDGTNKITLFNRDVTTGKVIDINYEYL